MESFPAQFIFGASTSAFQIEGAPEADGRGLSIWDEFAKRPGAVRGGYSAVRACEHYTHWREDVALIKELGLGAYRFSISWPRLLPTGRGTPNQKGIDFYSRLVDELLEKGITPFPTLFHWELPSALQREMGGFANRDIVPIFADYAALAVRALGDRVRNWITVNEPFEFACFGHMFGSHAPGGRSPRAFLRAMHHVLLSHGEAVRVIRAEVGKAVVGPALSWTPVHPETASPADAAAARRAEAFMDGITFDPILAGAYPRDVSKLLFPRLPVKEGDMEIISEPVDFVGLNYYSRERARSNPFMPFIRATVSGKDPRDLPETEDRTAMGWEVYHEGLREILEALRTRYGNPPVLVTEIGSAWTDERVESGSGPRVDDVRRTKYLGEQLRRIREAMDAGSDVRGCFVWSLLDNFEWAEGLSKRFGLVYVDFDTQERTIKESGKRLARFIASGNWEEFHG